MTDPERELWLHITAGQGPAECAWAVVKVLEQIQKEASERSIEFKEIEPGSEPGTAHSALVSISGGPALNHLLHPGSEPYNGRLVVHSGRSTNGRIGLSESM